MNNFFIENDKMIIIFKLEFLIIIIELLVFIDLLILNTFILNVYYDKKM